MRVRIVDEPIGISSRVGLAHAHRDDRFRMCWVVVSAIAWSVSPAASQPIDSLATAERELSALNEPGERGEWTIHGVLQEKLRLMFDPPPTWHSTDISDDLLYAIYEPKDRPEINDRKSLAPGVLIESREGGNDGFAATEQESWRWILAAAQQDDRPGATERETFSLGSLGESADIGEWNILARLQENLRVTLDLALTGNFTDKPGGFFYGGSVGIDAHKVFSNEDGDWGTAVMQVYLTGIQNVRMRPSFFDDEDDVELIFRIFNFNYTGFPGNAFNIRVGHFELPYGLEQVINTNGTLRQYTPRANLGQKLGWGVTINGVLQSFNYEVGYTYGDEMKFGKDGGHYTVSGRIGTPHDRNFEGGLSAFYGRHLESLGVGKRLRVGVDGQYHYGKWSTLGELSVGTDEEPDLSVLHLLLEQDWHSPRETVLLYAQLRASYLDPDGFDTDEAVGYALGLRWAPDNHWAYSVQLSHDDHTFGAAPEGTRLALQVRYRF